MAGVDIRTITQLMGHTRYNSDVYAVCPVEPGSQSVAVDTLVEFGDKGTPKRIPAKNRKKYFRINAKVAELADAPDLGSGGEIRGGSNPPFRTNFITNGLRPQ